MKRCPTCHRAYADDLSFCVEDAQALEATEVKTLADLLAGGAPVPVPRAVAIGLGLCEAYAAAHARGRVPPPITPLDVELSGDAVRVTFSDDATSAVVDATALDPAAPYAAPEHDDGPRSEATSVYTLGALVFAALTGAAPFTAATTAALAVRRLVEDAPSVRSLRAEVPASLDACLAKCLARDPADRPQSLAALRALLAEAAVASVAPPVAPLPSIAPPAAFAAPSFAAPGAAPLGAPAAAAPPVVATPARPRGGRALLVGGVAALIGAGALAVLTFGSSRRSATVAEVPAHTSAATAPMQRAAPTSVTPPSTAVATVPAPVAQPSPAVAMPAPLVVSPPAVEPRDAPPRVRPPRHRAAQGVSTQGRRAQGGGQGGAMADRSADAIDDGLPGLLGAATSTRDVPPRAMPRRVPPRSRVARDLPRAEGDVAPPSGAPPVQGVAPGGVVGALPTESLATTGSLPPPPTMTPPLPAPPTPSLAPPAPSPAPPARDTAALLALAAALASLGVVVAAAGAWRMRRRPSAVASTPMPVAAAPPVWTPSVPPTQIVTPARASSQADPYGSTMQATPQPSSAVWCLRCGQPCPADARFCPHDGADLQAQGSLSAPVTHPPSHADVAMRPFTVGAYVCEARLGEGGMGVVYRARHASSGQPCAVKVLLLRGRNDGAQIERFRREARLAASIRHPRSVAIYDYGEVSGQLFFLAMELVEGRSLDQVADRRPLPLPRVASIVSQVCDCLAAAHAAGVVHRDLKPQNVMVCGAPGRDAVKVVDFGIARDLHAASQTIAGTIVGTPGYMAPEQARGEPQVDGRVDVFSVGVMTWELLAGRAPFDAQGGAIQQVFRRAMLREPAPPVSAVDASLPPALDGVLSRATHPDPAQRTPDVSRFAQELMAASAPAWQAVS